VEEINLKESIIQSFKLTKPREKISVHFDEFKFSSSLIVIKSGEVAQKRNPRAVIINDGLTQRRLRSTSTQYAFARAKVEGD
jgi:hypothetical protein